LATRRFTGSPSCIFASDCPAVQCFSGIRLIKSDCFSQPYKQDLHAVVANSAQHAEQPHLQGLEPADNFISAFNLRRVTAAGRLWCSPRLSASTCATERADYRANRGKACGKDCICGPLYTRSAARQKLSIAPSLLHQPSLRRIHRGTGTPSARSAGQNLRVFGTCLQVPDTHDVAAVQCDVDLEGSGYHRKQTVFAAQTSETVAEADALSGVRPTRLFGKFHRSWFSLDESVTKSVEQMPEPEPEPVTFEKARPARAVRVCSEFECAVLMEFLRCDYGCDRCCKILK